MARGVDAAATHLEASFTGGKVVSKTSPSRRSMLAAKKKVEKKNYEISYGKMKFARVWSCAPRSLPTNISAKTRSGRDARALWGRKKE